MNQIHRDMYPPEDTYINGSNKGKQKWRVLENRIFVAHKSDNNKFNDGSFNFPTHPSSNIWKEELISIQGKKCCYCEKKLHNGVLEHYRPKKGYQQEKGDPIQRPGYYWLAYRWRNLLLSCSECNETSTKGNKFPVLGTRAVSPTCDLKLENAQLINPYEENPNESISFEKYDPISLNIRGRITIDILNLKDRNDLKEIRKDRFTVYSQALEFIRLENSGIKGINPQRIIESKEILKNAIKDKSQFSGMIKANLQKGILQLIDEK